MKLNKLTIIFFIFCLFFLTLFVYTRFELNIGSDDGTQYESVKRLYAYDELNPQSVVPQILSAMLFNIFPKPYWNFSFLLINFLCLIFSAVFLFLIAEKLFNRDIAFLSLILFIFTSSVNLSYTLRISPYIMGSLFSLAFFYYIVTLIEKPKDNKFFIIISIFILGVILTRRIWQLYIFIIMLFLGIYSIYLFVKLKESALFKKIILITLATSLLILPWILWRISLFGVNFYIDEYTWFFQPVILNYVNSLTPSLNPPPSLSSAVMYFENNAFRFYSFLFSLITITLGSVLVIFKNKIKKPFKIYLSLLAILFLTFYLLPVISSSVRQFDRYSMPGFFSYVLLLSMSLIYIFKIFHLNKKIKSFVIAIILLIFLLMIFNFFGEIFNSSYKNSISDQERYNKDALVIYSDLLNSENKNVLFRSKFVSHSLPKDSKIINLFEINESEARTYLLWENETRILEILENYNISYIFIYNKEMDLEEKYYNWTYIKYGKPANYLVPLKKSENFKKVYSGERIDIYKILQNNEPHP